MFNRNKYPPHLADSLTFGQQAVIFLWEVFKVVVISLAIIIPVRYFLIKPFYVKGASMEPTFHDHEYLIIDEISYRFQNPSRGEIIVFKDPLQSGQYLIKRVIGLPGEKIIIHNDTIAIQTLGSSEAVALDEPYLAGSVVTHGQVEVSLASDEFFVLGDNRPSSLDSRVFGPLKRSLIVGRTLWRGWPLNRMEILLKDIDYNF